MSYNLSIRPGDMLHVPTTTEFSEQFLHITGSSRAVVKYITKDSLIVSPITVIELISNVNISPLGEYTAQHEHAIKILGSPNITLKFNPLKREHLNSIFRLLFTSKESIIRNAYLY